MEFLHIATHTWHTHTHMVPLDYWPEMWTAKIQHWIHIDLSLTFDIYSRSIWIKCVLFRKFFPLLFFLALFSFSFVSDDRAFVHHLNSAALNHLPYWTVCSNVFTAPFFSSFSSCIGLTWDFVSLHEEVEEKSDLNEAMHYIHCFSAFDLLNFNPWCIAPSIEHLPRNISPLKSNLVWCEIVSLRKMCEIDANVLEFHKISFQFVIYHYFFFAFFFLVFEVVWRHNIAATIFKSRTFPCNGLAFFFPALTSLEHFQTFNGDKVCIWSNEWRKYNKKKRKFMQTWSLSFPLSCKNALPIHL